MRDSFLFQGGINEKFLFFFTEFLFCESKWNQSFLMDFSWKEIVFFWGWWEGDVDAEGDRKIKYEEFDDSSRHFMTVDNASVIFDVRCD